MDDYRFVDRIVVTKPYILSKISQEDIYSYYFNLAGNTNNINVTKSYCNPLRQDNSPSCRFYYNAADTLKFHDFAYDFNEDCFGFAAHYLHIDVNSKEGFKKILNDIALRFGLVEDNRNTKEILKQTFFEKIVKAKKGIDRTITFDIVPREWEAVDVQYWRQYGLTKQYLKYHKVYPIQHLYLNKNLKYTHNAYDPAYGYYFNKGRWKIYFPFRTKGDMPRFMQNTTISQGIEQFKPCKYAGLMKSYKDVMVLKKVCNGYFDIDSIAPSGEGYGLGVSDLNLLKQNSEYQFSLYDFDLTGVKSTNKFSKLYGIKPFYFTNGKLKTFNYKAKDISDLVALNSIDKVRTLFDKVVSKYEKEEKNSFLYNQITDMNERVLNYISS